MNLGKGYINLFDMSRLDATIFDDIVVDPRLDTDILFTTLLEYCGTLTPIYPDSRIFKFYLTNWFRRKYNIIASLIDTLEFEYNPIENYNRYENSDRKVDDTTVQNEKTNDVIVAENIGEQHDKGFSKTDDTIDNTTTNSVSAFDSDGFSNRDRSVVHGTDVANTNSSLDRNTKDNATTDREIKVDSDKIQETKDIFGSHGHGNIGVTTTQQLIEAERRVVLFDVYEWICREVEFALFIGDYTY